MKCLSKSTEQIHFLNFYNHVCYKKNKDVLYNTYQSYRESTRESSFVCFLVQCQRGNVSLRSIRDKTQSVVCLACEARLVISLICGEGKLRSCRRLQCTGRLKRVSALDQKSHLKPRRRKGLCSVCYFVILLMHELMLCIQIFICSDSLESKSVVYKGIFSKIEIVATHCFKFQAGRYNHEQRVYIVVFFYALRCGISHSRTIQLRRQIT